MFCQECGASLREDASVCPMCGKLVQVVVPSLTQGYGAAPIVADSPIAPLQGSGRCPHCGAENYCRAKQCHHCGIAFRMQDESAAAPPGSDGSDLEAACPHCGGEIDVHARRCAYCGAALIADEQVMETTCPRCGRPSPVDHTFCGHCGATLQQSQADPNGVSASWPVLEEPSSQEDRQASQVLTLVRLRSVIGAIQGILLLAVCLLLLFPLASAWWAVAAFLILSVIQLAVSLAIRRAGGRQAMDAVMEVERQGPFR